MDSELDRWWPDLGTVAAELRRAGQPASTSESAAARAWDAVMADVEKAFPGAKPLQWLGPKAKG